MKKSKSKKHSTTKESYAEQLSGQTFFVDRSSGRYSLVNGLRELGLKVEAHDDHFLPNTADVDWIEACGNSNWVIISSDKEIKKNILEKQAILNSRVAAFFFASTSITSVQQVAAVKSALRRITNLVVNEQRPFIARISPDGTVELWVNHRGKDLITSRRERRKKSE